MKTKLIAAALGLALCGPALAATCTKSQDLGAMQIGDWRAFGNTFTSAGAFNDCYSFELLANETNAVGVALEYNFAPYSTLGVDITSVSLSGGSLADRLTDTTAEQFSFTNLLTGHYLLEVTGMTMAVTPQWAVTNTATYAGHVVAAPTPEPETYAMLALGLAGVGFASRRRQAAPATAAA